MILFSVIREEKSFLGQKKKMHRKTHSMEHTNDQSQCWFRKAQCKENPIHFQWAQPPSGEIQVTRKLTTTNPGNRESSAGTDPP